MYCLGGMVDVDLYQWNHTFYIEVDLEILGPQNHLILAWHLWNVNKNNIKLQAAFFSELSGLGWRVI